MIFFGFIRHGSTSWNKEGRAHGHSDIPLDDEGIAQAKALARALSNENWDVVYTSDLLRAKQTAEVLVKEIQCPFIVDERLRELKGGLIEGTTEEERIEKWGKDWGSNWATLGLGLETAEEGKLRAKECIEHIIQTYPGKNVLIVTHGALLQHLLNELIPLESMDGKLKNTSITRVKFEENQWNCHTYNCVKHLEESIKLS